MKKALFIVSMLASLNFSQDLQEFSLLAGGGLSSLAYSPTVGDKSSQFDVKFGFGYSRFFSPRFGIGTGVELAFYASEYNLKEFTLEYKSKDIFDPFYGSEEFDFSSELHGYKETHELAMLQIPLMLQFQSQGQYKIYAAGGAKFGIPLSASRLVTADTMYNKGYYEYEGITYDSVPERGFHKYKSNKSDEKQDFNLAILLSMEAGFKWRFESGLSIYTGAYFDYGLNNVLSKRSTESQPYLIDYNIKEPTYLKTPGVFDSKVENDKIPPQSIVGTVHPYAIGLVVKLSLGNGLDYFDRKSEIASADSAEAFNLESEKNKILARELERDRAAAQARAAKEKEAQSAADAQKILQETRALYAAIQREQASQAAEAEIARLAAEKVQLEREIERLASTAQSQPPPAPPAEVPPAAAVEPLPVPPSGEFAIQVAVVLEEARASAMAEALKKNGFTAYYRRVTNPGKLTGIYYRVRIGYFASTPEADSFARARLSQSYSDWWIDRTANDSRGF